jgi:predicted kinase
MKKVIILQGLPASGKSTYAKQLVKDNIGMYKRLNKDDLRAMLDVGHHTTSNEKFVEKVRDLMLIEALKEGKHVVIDDTNLSDRPVERIRQVVQKYRTDTGEQVEIEIKSFEINVEEAIARDAKRGEASVGKNVIMRMYKQHILKNERGPHYKAQDTSLPPAILCDLDGTLAIIKDRSPFDGKSCGSDELNEPIAEILRTYRANGNVIIFMSGRNEEARQVTMDWLAKHNIEYDGLNMRLDGDNRKDSIIKKELFEKYIQGKYFVRFVLDDRDQVVDTWRLDLGLPCLQVNYGDF